MDQMNEAGFALLRTHEGCVLYAYDDANDRRVEPGEHCYGTLTIGYGHTGNDVVPGLVWTEEQAEEALARDVDIFASHILPMIRPAQLTDDQFSAFVCFSYNIGLHAFAGSSALHMALTDCMDRVPACMMLWDKVMINGHLVVSKGLANRRQAEIDLWSGRT